MSKKRSAPASSNAAGRAAFVLRAAPWMAALALTACGGGGAGVDSAPAATAPAAPPETIAQVPPSAGASTQSFVTFAQGLGEDNSAEPLGMSSFLPPTDDTAEPLPIG